MTPWTVAHQAPLSIGFSRQEYWSGLPFPSPGIFPTQESNPGLPHPLHCRQILYCWATREAPERQWFQPTGVLCRCNEMINQDCLAQHLAKLMLNKWQLILLLLYQIVVSCLLCTNTVLGIERYKKEIIYNLFPRAESWQIIFWKRPGSK